MAAERHHGGLTQTETATDPLAAVQVEAWYDAMSGEVSGLPKHLGNQPKKAATAVPAN
jgi:hypothetical protein